VSEHDEPEGYDGEVTVRLDGEPEQRAHAALVARFDPLAGALVWTGRISAAVAARTEVEIVTPHGIGRARATEQDVWGNTRVSGIGRPPFPVELLDIAGNAAGED
jgi:hypothetical protein